MTDATDKTKSLLTLTAVVASRVQIDRIRLCNAGQPLNLPPPGTPLRIEFGFNGEATADHESNRIAVRAFFMVRANTARMGSTPHHSLSKWKPNSSRLHNQFFRGDYRRGIGRLWQDERHLQCMAVLAAVRSDNDRQHGVSWLTLPVLTGETIRRTMKSKNRRQDNRGHFARAVPGLNRAHAVGQRSHRLRRSGRPVACCNSPGQAVAGSSALLTFRAFALGTGPTNER